MIEVHIIGGSHDGEWVEIPDDAQNIRIYRRAVPPSTAGFKTADDDAPPHLNVVEEFDLVPNPHFRGFAEAVLRS